MAHAAQAARKRFAISALLLGALYALVAPPLMAPDEARHLMRAYELSEGRLVTRSTEGGAYYEAPGALAQLVESYGSLRTDGARRVDLTALLADVRGGTKAPDKVRVQALIDSRGPLAYATLVPGIWLARGFGMSPLLHLYAARLSSLVAYVSLVGLAILLVEQLAWLWLAFALSPALLMQAATCSPDSFTSALSLLFFALVMRGAFLKKEGLSARERQLVLALWLSLSLCSLQTLAFAVCLFALPWPRAEGSPARLSAPIVALALAFALSTAWLLLRYPSPAALVRNWLPLSDWMLEHPLLVAKTWIRTAFKQIDDYAIEVTAGTGPFIEDLRFVAGLVTAFHVELLALLALGALAPNAELPRPGPRRPRRFLAAGGALYVAICFALAHAAGNDNHRPTWPIFQLSGSAFIALMPALYGLLTTVGRPVASRWLLKRSGYRILALAVSMNLLCLIALVGRYYATVDPAWPY